MKQFKVALQLYSIRDAMEKDMDAALGAVKAMGYDYVEFAGYFDKTADEVKALLDKHGLTCISVHQGIDPFLGDGAMDMVNYLKTIGATYCAIPWYPIENLSDDAGRAETVENFTKVGELLKANDIKLMYHNHDFEFNTYDGKYLLDWMYETISADVLMPQIDTCWVHYAGVNPAEYVEKYAGRIKVLHLKDFVCSKLGGGPVYALIDENGKEMKDVPKEEKGFEFRPVGYGIQDFPAILAAAEKAGVEYVVVEQDNSPDGDPLGDAKKSREYLKTLGL
ncbi:MAG: sugar phosphate isomerase/epimerase [Ruminococcaceae bacterium]|nr:sugar phosphate isomerase/epimerase [Oscillospiraceae bacterium]